MGLTEIEKYINQYRLAPRDIDLAARFVQQKVGRNTMLIYGAGSHTQLLLNKFEQIGYSADIIGIIDQRVEGKFAGYPVFRPHQIKNSLADFVVLSHNEYEHTMKQALEETGNQIPVIAIYSDQDFLEFSLNNTPLDIEIKTHLPKILFVSLEREIVDQELTKKLQEKYYSIKGYLNREGIFDEPGSFNRQVDLKQSFALLYKLIEQVKPQLIYLHDQYSRGNFLAAFLKRRYPDIKIIGEYYDFLCFTFDDPYITTTELYYTNEDVKNILWGEDNSRNLDGVVVKEGGKPVERFFANTNLLHFGHYLPASFNRFQLSEAENKRKNLVYAGNINRGSNSSLLFGDNILIDLFNELIQYDFNIHIYINIDSISQIKEYYPEYFQLAKKTGKLFINSRLPLDQLVETIAKFDYGILLMNFTPEIKAANQIRIKTTFPSKFYTYLAAGLPILFNDLEFAGEFVDKYKIGKKINRFSQIDQISYQEYNQLKQNIKKVQPRLSLEKQQERYLDFIEGIIGQ